MLKIFYVSLNYGITKKYRTIDNKFSLSAINEEEKEEEVDEEKVK